MARDWRDEKWWESPCFAEERGNQRLVVSEMNFADASDEKSLRFDFRFCRWALSQLPARLCLARKSVVAQVDKRQGGKR